MLQTGSDERFTNESLLGSLIRFQEFLQRYPSTEGLVMCEPNAAETTACVLAGHVIANRLCRTDAEQWTELASIGSRA